MKAIIDFFEGRFDLALNPMLEMYAFAAESSMWQFWPCLPLLYNDRPEESLKFIDTKVKEPGQDIISQLIIFMKYVIIGDKDKLQSLLAPDFVKHVQIDSQLSWHMAGFYSYIGEKEKSLEWLENAVNRGFINYPFLNEYDKLLNNVREEEGFKKLMKRVKHEWENFEA